MVWEKVTYKKGVFTTVFCFSNTTKFAQKVKIGFPVKSYIYTQDDYYNMANTAQDILKYVEDKICFKSFLDGKELERKAYYIKDANEAPDGMSEYDVIYIGEIMFFANQSVIVENYYKQTPEDLGIDKFIGYILTSGATWKNPIQRSYIKICIPYIENPLNSKVPMYYEVLDTDTQNLVIIKRNYVDARPPYNEAKMEDGQLALIWDYKNFTPESDIRIYWEDVYESEPWYAKSKTEYYSAHKDEDIVDIDDIFNGIIQMIEYNDPIKFQQHTIEDFSDSDHFYSFISVVGLDIVEHYEKYKNIKYDLTQIIRYIINGINAINGYSFNTPLWQEYYKTYEWYTPEYAVPKNTPAEAKLIEKLQKIADKFKKGKY